MKCIWIGCCALLSTIACAGGADPGSSPTGADAAPEASDTSEDTPPVPDAVPTDPIVTTVDPETCAEASKKHSSLGCEYWPTVTPNPVWSTFDFAIIVTNPGVAEAAVTVTGPAGFSADAKIAGGGSKTIYLPWVALLKGLDFDACGKPPPQLDTRVVKAGAYHVLSSIPVMVHQFNAIETRAEGGPEGKDWSECTGHQVCPERGVALGCYAFSTEGSLLLPTASLTTDYFLSGWIADGGGGAAVVATRDGSTVEVTDRFTGIVLRSFILDRGDVALIMPEKDHYGTSRIVADAPVQVIAVSPCSNSPGTAERCNHAEESVLPTDAIGRDYLLPPSTAPNGAAAGRYLSWFGFGAPGTITSSKGGTSVISSGNSEIEWTTDRLRWTADTPFALSSIVLVAALESAGQPGFSAETNVIAIDQYRSRYVFPTPAGFDDSYAEIVARKGTKLLLDGAPLPATFEPVTGTFGVYRQKVAPGTHELRADQPVGLQLVGYGMAASYAFPAAAGFPGLDANVPKK